MDRFRRAPAVTLACPAGVVDARVAERPLARLLGLALLREPPRHGLLLPSCRSVHTFGMRFAIDVAFLSRPERDPSAYVRAYVVDVRAGVAPGRLLAARLRDVAALELAAGAAARLGIAPGVSLAVLGFA